MNSVENEIKQVISNVLNVSVDEVLGDVEIGELKNWDSLHYIQILNSIEEQCSIHFKDADLMSMETVEDIISVVKERVNEQ